jgi:hypothetical protein
MEEDKSPLRPILYSWLTQSNFPFPITYFEVEVVRYKSPELRTKESSTIYLMEIL